MARLAFVGLGIMGAPMARHLLRGGHEVAVSNRTFEKAQAFAEREGGRACASVTEAFDGADAAFLCVGNDADVAGVFAAGASALPKGAIIVDHTTTSAEIARGLAAAASERGLEFVDAPVSGGQAGAEAGRLTIMAGGEETAIERVRPYLACYALAITRIGPSGSGQLAKMVNQICIAGVVQGLAEGLHFAARAGLDPETLIGAISKGAAQSWQMENRWRTMTNSEFEFGFAVDWMRKDLGLVLDEARRNGARVPIAALVDQFYAEVQGMGGRRWDTSSLIARLTKGDRK
jgi:3-hydroxyisobutyrate dehydrogenase-like beta-hydroxyacid dehydrogenase